MRAFNRALSLLFGLALIAGGLLVVVEVVTGLLRDSPWPLPVDQWAATLRASRFSDTASKTVFVVAAAVGLALLVAEARPWPKRSLVLTTDGQRSWWLNRRSAERHLGRLIRSGTSATAANVRLRPRTRRWTVRVAATAAPKARPAVEARTREVLERLGAPDGSSVRVRIARRRRVD
jgi:hypothetical protein